MLSLMGLLVGGWKLAVVLAAVTAVAFTLTGTPVGSALGLRAAGLGARQKGEHQWRSGLFSRNRREQMRLPGLLGRIELIEYQDVYGNPFAVLKHPKAGGLYTIVARCEAEGPLMQDEDRVNAWVAGFGQVLASAGQESALVAAKAITDTAPDPGGRLGAMVRGMRVENSPSLAQQVMDECVEQYPASSSHNMTYFELTFRGRLLHRKGDEQEILSELSRRVPGLIAQLQEAGGGSVEMVSAAELPKIVRAAFDPLAQDHLEAAELAGEDEGLVPWSEAGPVAHQEFWDRYVHDSGNSVTWEMTAAPRMAVRETAVASLLAPHLDFARKRVALVYRPAAPDESLNLSERDLSTATFAATQSQKRMSAAAKRTIQAAERSTEQVAEGAVMVSFSLLVTTTTTSDQDALQAASTVTSQAGAVPIRLRRCYGSQAAAFAATLPVGFLPWEHTVIPDKVREWM